MKSQKQIDQIRQLGLAKRTHGKSGTPEHKSWKLMRSRCLNPRNQDWADYGGRGIAICERWSDFMCFYDDMGPRPSAKHSLDRIDNSRGYAPDNCRWATNKQQANNRRPHRKHRRLRRLKYGIRMPRISTREVACFLSFGS